MLANPAHWRNHYVGAEEELRSLRHFSYADRIRYYRSQPEAQLAILSSFAMLDDIALSEPLLLQFFDSATLAQASRMPNFRRRPAAALVEAEIQRALMPYLVVTETAHA